MEKSSWQVYKTEFSTVTKAKKCDSSTKAFHLAVLIQDAANILTWFCSDFEKIAHKNIIISSWSFLMKMLVKDYKNYPQQLFHLTFSNSPIDRHQDLALHWLSVYETWRHIYLKINGMKSFPFFIKGGKSKFSQRFFIFHLFMFWKVTYYIYIYIFFSELLYIYGTFFNILS